MSRNRHEIARLAAGFALMVAVSPLAGQSPTPLNGIRTALELITGKGSGKLAPIRHMHFGHA